MAEERVDLTDADALDKIADALVKIYGNDNHMHATRDDLKAIAARLRADTEHPLAAREVSVEAVEARGLAAAGFTRTVKPAPADKGESGGDEVVPDNTLPAVEEEDVKSAPKGGKKFKW